MIITDASQKLIESPMDGVVEGEGELVQLSILVSDVSIDTAAADWDTEESREYEKFILDSKAAAEGGENVDELRPRRFLAWLTNVESPMS